MHATRRHHDALVNRPVHFDGVRPTAEQVARLRAFCRGKALRVAASSLGSTEVTVGRLLDGAGVKAESLERILGRLP
jgi:hypothetical protein